MKKAIAYFFTLLIILLVSSVFLISCKAKQQQPDVNWYRNIEKDSSSHIKTTDHSKAIIDSLLIYIHKIKTAKPECDSVTNAALDNLLRTINTSKHSGDNSYEIKYNELLKRLELIIKVGATKNEVTQDFTLKDRFIDRFITKTITIKEQLPKWQLYLMIIGIGTILYFVIKLVLLIKKFIPV